MVKVSSNCCEQWALKNWAGHSLISISSTAACGKYAHIYEHWTDIVCRVCLIVFFFSSDKISFTGTTHLAILNWKKERRPIRLVIPQNESLNWLKTEHAGADTVYKGTSNRDILQVISRLRQAALCVRWSHCGRKFAIGGAGKEISVCCTDGKDDWWGAALIRKHGSAVMALAWHPEGDLLASVCTDCTCRIFHASPAGMRASSSPWTTAILTYPQSSSPVTWTQTRRI